MRQKRPYRSQGSCYTFEWGVGRAGYILRLALIYNYVAKCKRVRVPCTCAADMLL